MKQIMIVLMCLLFISGCSKNVATCLSIQDNGTAGINLGYFYDSSELHLTGPIKYDHVPVDMPYNPCNPQVTPNSVAR